MSQGIVLIADDDADFVAQLTRILLAENYLVLGATNGKDARKLLDQHELGIGLFIVDIFMPGINGFELIGMVTRHKVRPKIIAISAARQKVLDDAVALGADACVKKPEAGSALTVEKWLEAVLAQIGLGENPPTRGLGAAT